MYGLWRTTNRMGKSVKDAGSAGAFLTNMNAIAIHSAQCAPREFIDEKDGEGMRLIDADFLKKNVEKWLNPDQITDKMVSVENITVSVMMEIEEQPTAYDVDKVVAELEKMADKANDNIMVSEQPQYHDGYEDGVLAAIQIVKGGGVDG